MKNKMYITMFTLALSMFSANAAVITGVTATATTEVAGRTATNLVNGSGLSGGTHGTNPWEMWLSAASVPQSVVFDLGSVYNVTQLNVWNYNEGGDWAGGPLVDIGSNAVTVTYGTTLSGFTLGGSTGTVGAITTFAKATGLATYTGETFSTSFNARYVKFDISSNYGHPAYQNAALSEVQFTGIAVPEPSAALLGGLGMLALLRRRR
jgi:hypothetical protein